MAKTVFSPSSWALNKAPGAEFEFIHLSKAEPVFAAQSAELLCVSRRSFRVPRKRCMQLFLRLTIISGHCHFGIPDSGMGFWFPKEWRKMLFIVEDKSRKFTSPHLCSSRPSRYRVGAESFGTVRGDETSVGRGRC